MGNKKHGYNCTHCNPFLLQAAVSCEQYINFVTQLENLSEKEKNVHGSACLNSMFTGVSLSGVSFREQVV